MYSGICVKIQCKLKVTEPGESERMFHLLWQIRPFPRPVHTDFRPMSGQSSVNAIFLWYSVSQGLVRGEPHSGPRVDLVKISCFKWSIVWRTSPVQIWSHTSHVSLLCLSGSQTNHVQSRGPQNVLVSYKSRFCHLEAWTNVWLSVTLHIWFLCLVGGQSRCIQGDFDLCLLRAPLKNPKLIERD